MELTNYTNIMAENLNNPDCAFLSGMFMGNFLSLRLILIYIIIGFIVGLGSKFTSLFFDWVRMKLKIIKK